MTPPPRQCEAHVEFVQSLATEMEARRNLERADDLIRADIKSLDGKVDKLDGRVQKVESNLSKYAGGLAVLVIVIPILIKIVPLLFSAFGPGIARAAGH